MRNNKTGKHLSEETKKKISLVSKRIGISSETRAKMVASRKAHGNYVMSEEQRAKLCIARRKRVITEETRRKLGNTTRGHKYALGHRHSPETIEHLRQVHKKQWENPEYRDKVVKNTYKSLNVKPNKPETKLIDILNEIEPNAWDYTGNGKIVIGGKIPDFCHKDNIKIIEYFGEYWHRQRARCYEETEKGRIEHFAKYGRKTLIIWEDEFKNRLQVSIDKIKNFIKN
jgi:hypothetical protein